MVVAINALVTFGLFFSLSLLARFSFSLASKLQAVIPYLMLFAITAQAVGFWLCSDLPGQTGERPLFLAAFFFQGGAAALCWLVRFVSWFDFFESLAVAQMAISWLASGVIAMAAAQVFFVFGVRGVAVHLQSRQLSASVFNYMIYLASLVPA
jgi:hypothetical protein